MRYQGFGVILAVVIAGPAAADVMVVRSVQSESMAGFGGGAPKLTTTWIAGARHREETRSEGKPTMMEKLAGIGHPEITRLDKKLRWRLNPPKKTYEESPLVLPTAPASKSDDSQSNDSRDQGGPEDKPTTRISKAEFKVTPLAQKKRVGTFDCSGYELRMLLETEDLETHKKSAMRMVNTLWTTPEQGAVAHLKKEEADYAQAYAKAIGITASDKAVMQSFGMAMAASLAGSGEKELSSALAGMPAELKKIKGYPIVSRVEFYSQGDDTDASAAESGEESAEIPTDAGDALGSLAGGFLKKKMEAKKPAPTADGQLVMAMTSEIKSITTDAIAGATFEIPAGFKKTNAK